MLSVFSRFVDASIVMKNSSGYSTSLTFNPTSHTSFFKNKDLASYGSFHGSITRSLKYNPCRPKFIVLNNIGPPEPPLPSGSPSGSLRNWIVGIVLTFALPLITRKWGPLILFKNKVDTVMERTEQVMEAIEAVAKGADEIIDEITDNLPENSKLKNTMEAIDEVVEGVATTAHIANHIIDKVEETEDKLESLILDHNTEEEEAAASKGVMVMRAQEEEVPTQEPRAQN